VIAALMSKAPALVFPALLFLYIWLFGGEKPRSALLLTMPSVVVTARLGYISAGMAPSSFTPVAISSWGYRITQPLVIFRYFRTFFILAGLTADTGRLPYGSVFQDAAPLGFLFLLALVLLAVRRTRMRETRPIAFGPLWFLLAVLPTSVFPLAEVENDHRMFFPFVGLTLAVVWAAALWGSMDTLFLARQSRGMRPRAGRICLGLVGTQ
jgi:protein O-mannosyl-transferase